MSEEPDSKPIYSSRADDLELRESIDEFVVGVAERIDGLQDAEAREDRLQLLRLAASLAADAARNGFEPLARAAQAVEAACAGADRRELHGRVRELTRLAQRIRLGHRGSV